MPKITKTIERKPKVVTVLNQETEKPPLTVAKSAESERRIVFRLFECLMRLEEASRQISQVGVYPGPGEKAASFKTKVAVAKQTVDALLKEYQAEWGAIQK